MRPTTWIALLLLVGTTGCSEPIDLREGLELVDVTTGWVDAGVFSGANKLVPSISFRVRNTSDQTLVVLQLNVVFRRLDDPAEWASRYIKVVGSEGLAPGETSDLVTATSERGYTGTDPRAEMLKNAEFVDAQAELSAKYGSALLQRVADIPIERRLLAQ